MIKTKKNNQFTTLGFLTQTLCLLIVFSAGPALANVGKNSGNPWYAVTRSLMDQDHGHLLREASPFDEMTRLELATIPKGNRIHFNAPSNCVPARLKQVLAEVAAKYGPVTVNSTFRSKQKNRKIGGKKRSWHLKCAAVDFRVHGKTKGLLAFLRDHKKVGGYKRYRSGFYHIDIGPKRTW